MAIRKILAILGMVALACLAHGAGQTMGQEAGGTKPGISFMVQGMEDTLVSGDLVAWAEAGSSSFGGRVFHEVRVRLTPEGQRAMARLTGTHLGKTMQILLDGEVILSAAIVEPIDYPEFLINLASLEEARALAVRIRGRD